MKEKCSNHNSTDKLTNSKKEIYYRCRGGVYQGAYIEDYITELEGVIKGLEGSCEIFRVLLDNRDKAIAEMVKGNL